jgi:hypothetical protein
VSESKEKPKKRVFGVLLGVLGFTLAIFGLSYKVE